MPNNSPAIKSVPSVIRYFHANRNGQTLELTDSGGCVTRCDGYAAWGRVYAKSGDERPLQPLRFQGQYGDTETGLHYNQHRYYDADAGRFLTPDPLGLIGGLHSYAYVRNPVSWCDPLGLQGVNLNLAGDPFAEQWASMFSHGPEYFSVLSHGHPHGLTGNLQGTYTPPSQLADFIRNTPGYHPNQTILLLACHAGSERNQLNPQNSSYGQTVSDELRQPVIAANAPVNVIIHNGVASVQPANGGWWRMFIPQ